MSGSLAGAMAGTEAMAALFGAAGGARALLAVEAGFARAAARGGRISPAAAAAIVAACDGAGAEFAGLDLAALARAGAVAGTIVIPLVAWLRGRVGGHAAAVHRGLTSQDVIDTALVLQLRDGLALLEADLAAAAAATAGLARDHAGTPMLARTLLQPALPTRFGLKAAGWMAGLDDARASLRAAAAGALVLQCGGAAGTLDGFGPEPLRLAQAFAEELALPLPPLPWHTRRAPLARLGATLAAAVGVAGKIATDLALLMQAEVGEASEPAAPGRGGSSAMAHKRNPTLAIAARAAALRTPALAATLLAAIPGEHERAAGAWQAEQAVWPELMLAASGAFAAVREALAGLVVDPAAMARNLALAPEAGASVAVGELLARALAAHAAPAPPGYGPGSEEA